MGEASSKYQNLLKQLPKVNQCMIKQLLNYLVQVNSNASSNLMGIENLSIVFGEMTGIFSNGMRIFHLKTLKKFHFLFIFN